VRPAQTKSQTITRRSQPAIFIKSPVQPDPAGIDRQYHPISCDDFKVHASSFNHYPDDQDDDRLIFSFVKPLIHSRCGRQVSKIGDEKPLSVDLLAGRLAMRDGPRTWQSLIDEAFADRLLPGRHDRRSIAWVDAA